MANLKMFAVRDKKVGIFMKPFFDVHTGQALRSWEEACSAKESPFNKFPLDFSFFQLGEFDDLTGSLNILESPLELSSAAEVLGRRDAQLSFPGPDARNSSVKSQ